MRAIGGSSPWLLERASVVRTSLPLTSVTVLSAAADRSTLTVETVPSALRVGATLLGQPIIKIDGAGPATVTLAGTANETIVSDTDRPITPALDYYYSPHAERVFAHQPGGYPSPG